MDRNTVDRLARALAARSSRRGFGGLLLALGIGTGGGLPTFGVQEAGAQKRRKRKNKSRDRSGSCKRDCKGKECGPDGCGGSCGQCPSGSYCSARGRQCVSYCGACPAGSVCHDGKCCAPNCVGKVCGDDGCGRTCGSCPVDQPLCLSDGSGCVPVLDLP
jgi:hypothetical protein